MLLSLLNHAKQQGLETVTGYVNETESNWRMKPLFEKRNFKLLKKEGAKTYYQFLTKQFQTQRQALFSQTFWKKV